MGINDFYKNISSVSELDLRQEMINTIDGSFPEVSKSTTGLLRSMNTDSNGNLVLCPCVDPVTHEPDKDTFCPICFGMKYIWTESYVDFYKAPYDKNLADKQRNPGLVNIATAVFYFKWDTQIKKQDRIIEIELDASGEVKKPVVRTAVWKIQEMTFFRLDNGRLEYIKAYTSEDDIRYLNIP